MDRFPIAYLALILAGCLGTGSDILTIGTTTTTQDMGLLEVILPSFERDTGLKARAVVGGTGEAIEKAKHGDVDVLLTHSPIRERALVEDGTALSRRPVMFNRFVLAGIPEDPAGIRAASSAVDAFRRIHDNRSTFFSRGDQSGTHDKELALWASAGLDPTRFDHAWYKETGTGQGATLATAAEFDAYIFVDEGTILQFHAQRKAIHAVILLTDDPALRNQYAVTQLHPAAIPVPLKTEWADRFASWITGPQGQAVIDGFHIDGQRVFTANANETDA